MFDAHIIAPKFLVCLSSLKPKHSNICVSDLMRDARICSPWPISEIVQTEPESDLRPILHQKNLSTLCAVWVPPMAINPFPSFPIKHNIVLLDFNQETMLKEKRNQAPVQVLHDTQVHTVHSAPTNLGSFEARHRP